MHTLSPRHFLLASKYPLFALALIGFAVYPNILYPDVFTKGLYARFFITLSAVLFAWYAAKSGMRLPKMTPLAWAIVSFAAVLLVSMFLSPGVYRSFWGEAQRMEGVVGILLYGILFFVARSIFTARDWLSYFKLVTLTVPILVLYAILQSFAAHSGAALPFIYGATGSPGSLFGNPAFFSGFLIFAAGFSSIVYVLEKREGWKMFSVSVAILSLGTIVWLGVRGAVLASLVGLLFFFGCRALGSGKRNPVRIYVAALLIFLVGAAFLVSYHASLSDKYPLLLQRIINLPKEPSFATRWLSLESSARAWLDSPKTMLLGWGQEHFITGYNAYYNPEHGTYEDVWFDRAHNKLADVLVMQGAAGLLAYLSIFALLGRCLFRLSRVPHYRAVACGAGALLAAYFLNNLTLFDLPQSYVNFFLLAGFIDSLALPLADREIPRTASGKNPVRLGAAIFLTAVALAFFVYSILIPVAQSRRYVHYFRTHNGDELVARWHQIFRPRNFAHVTLLDDFWRRLQERDSFRDPAFLPVTNRLIEEMEYVIRRDPKDAQMLLRLGNIYTERAIGSLGGGKETGEDFKRGEELARRAIALSPRRQESYYLLAFNLQGQGRGAEAVRIMKDAVALNPKTKKAKYVYAVNLALAGDLGNSVKLIEEVRKGGWFTSLQAKDIRNSVTIYVAAGDMDLLRDFLASVLENGLSEEKEYFLGTIRSYIKIEDAERVGYWVERYKAVHPDTENEMKIVLELVKRGDWATLKKL